MSDKQLILTDFNIVCHAQVYRRVCQSRFTYDLPCSLPQNLPNTCTPVAKRTTATKMRNTMVKAMAAVLNLGTGLLHHCTDSTSAWKQRIMIVEKQIHDIAEYGYNATRIYSIVPPARIWRGFGWRSAEQRRARSPGPDLRSVRCKCRDVGECGCNASGYRLNTPRK